MMRMSLKWISLTAASALLMAGCAAGPNRTPDRNLNQSNLMGNNVSTTTGDADACAAALGNTVAPGGAFDLPGGDRLPDNGVGANRTGVGANRTGIGANRTGIGADRTGIGANRTGVGGNRAGLFGGNGGGGEITANGLLIGNVALVALPTMDQMPTNTNVGAPGTATANNVGVGTKGTPATGIAAPGTPAAGTAAPPNPIATAPAGPGNNAAAGAPGGVMGTRTNAATTPGAGAPGGAATGGAGTAGMTGGANATGDADAIERIKMACDKVADVRVVNSAADRARLAEITDAIREGRPVTEFMTDLSRLVQAATSAGGGRNANRGPAGAAPPATPAPATPITPVAPDGTPPGALPGAGGATPGTPGTTGTGGPAAGAPGVGR